MAPEIICSSRRYFFPHSCVMRGDGPMNAPLLGAWATSPDLAVEHARTLRRQARTVRADTEHVKRSGAWLSRRRICGGSSAPIDGGHSRLPLRAIIDELEEGALCVKCLATRRRFTRVEVEIAINRLRREFVLDSIVPCRDCGSARTVSLHRPERPRFLYVIVSRPES